MRVLLTICGLVAPGVLAPSRLLADPPPGTTQPEAPPKWAVLPSGDRGQLDRSVERALAWLAAGQAPDGSFPSIERAQPAVTALCVLAFLSCGHCPGQGRYGPAIDEGLAYILKCQSPDGLIARVRPRAQGDRDASQCAAYDHAIGGLALSEAYGMTTGETSRRIRSTLESALAYALRKQPAPKRLTADKGGWRYEQYWQDSDADLSVTGWYLMFLRSCRNAGFDVPSASVDEALSFVRRCYDPRQGTFWYALRGTEHVQTRGMVGVGALTLALGGQHNTDPARMAGQWLLEHPFDRYNEQVPSSNDRFFYGAFYCSQAMFQLGQGYWERFYPVLLHTLVSNQRPDGSWDRESRPGDHQYGETYTTALAVLALTPPYQLLPIFQR